MLSRLELTLKSPIARRLLKGAGAYGYAQCVSIVTQLISLPIFLTVWDLVTYGNWILISAVPFYLSLTDAGVSTASANRMIRLVARGRYTSANSVFQSSIAFLAIVTGCSLTAVGIALAAIPGASIQIENWKLVLLLLSGTVFLQMFCSQAEAVFKATQDYAKGTYVVTTGRLAEWLGGVAGLLLYESFVGVAASMFSVRAFYTCYAISLANRKYPTISFGIKHARIPVIKSVAAPGLAFVALGLTSALSLQGFTILAGACLGSSAAAIFNAYRTIARVVFQLSGAISNPLWPELGALYGSGEFAKFRSVYRRAEKAGLAIAVLGSLLIFAFASFGLEIWSKGKIEYNPHLMALFAIYVASACAWQMPRMVLMSIDGHAGLALRGIAVAVCSLICAALVTPVAGLYGVVAAMIAGEVAMWHLSNREARKLPALADTR